MTDVYRLIEQMEKRIEELPIGYISKKQTGIKYSIIFNGEKAEK